MTLHIVSQSPWSGPAFSQCCRALVPGDVLLLLADGVFAASRPMEPAKELEALAGAIRVLVLADDCAVRGLHELASGVECTDYAGFVALACEHPRSVSWF